METNSVPVVIVVAMEKRSRAIGYKNTLLWHIPEDLKRFKTLTAGHPVIMGRKTFESIIDILGKPLPGRTNIVITRNADYQYEANNVQVVTSLEDAMAVALREAPKEIHIGGGAELYKQALPYVSRIHATFVDDENRQADTFFPDFSDDFMISKVYPETEQNGVSYQWLDFSRLT